MQFDSQSIVWAAESLAGMGHPDPEGLIAKIESSKDDENITGITKEEAAQVGIRSISEPVMSLYATALFDTKNNRTYRVSDSRRAEINSRINQSLMDGTQQQNPFLDAEGFLRLSHQPKAVKDPSDKDLLDAIYKIMDETL
jgi:membrane-anchored protein YejM (alkaline phosphatase superfamily)